MDGIDDFDEEEASPQPVEQVPESVEIHAEIPVGRTNLASAKLFFVKLPNFLSIDTHEYDPDTYEDEIDEDEVLDNEGRARMKLKVENTIRWRNVENEKGEITKQTNARVIQWSDGTMSLYLGSEIFDLSEKQMADHSHLFIKQGTSLQGQGILRNKLIFRPSSTDSFTHRKLTLSIADRSQKTQKIRIVNFQKEDPEDRLNQLREKEDENLKALKRETKRKIPYNNYLTSNYLEPEDDGAISISAIKKGVYIEPSSEESSDADEDDSDPDFGSTQKRHVVVESDDE